MAELEEPEPESRMAAGLQWVGCCEFRDPVLIPGYKETSRKRKNPPLEAVIIQLPQMCYSSRQEHQETRESLNEWVKGQDPAPLSIAIELPPVRDCHTTALELNK